MPFQPGESGNPAGSYKGRPFTDALRRALARAELEGNFKDLNALAESLIAKALTGDVPALRELADRIDGKVVQPVAAEIRTGPLLTHEQVLAMAEAVIEGDALASARATTETA